MHTRITERNTSTVDIMFTLGKPSLGKNLTTSLDKILQQDTMSNLVPDTSYRNRVMIYKKDTELPLSKWAQREREILDSKMAPKIVSCVPRLCS